MLFNFKFNMAILSDISMNSSMLFLYSFFTRKPTPRCPLVLVVWQYIHQLRSSMLFSFVLVSATPMTSHLTFLRACSICIILSSVCRVLTLYVQTKKLLFALFSGGFWSEVPTVTSRLGELLFFRLVLLFVCCRDVPVLGKHLFVKVSVFLRQRVLSLS